MSLNLRINKFPDRSKDQFGDDMNGSHKEEA